VGTVIGEEKRSNETAEKLIAAGRKLKIIYFLITLSSSSLTEVS
jgi:hypothetical protein